MKAGHVMLRLAALAITSVLAVGALSGCALARGPLTAEDRSIDAATAIVLDTPGNLTISEGEPALVIHAPSSALRLLTSEVRNGVLTLGARPGTAQLLFGEVRYDLTLPSLEHLEINGSGDVVSDVPIGDLEVEINGTGDIEVSAIDGSRVSIDISGSGDVELHGRTGDLAISVDGSADIVGHRLDAERVTVEVDGSGDIDVAASESLDVSLSGSGTVTYSGKPEITEDISGSGEVRPRD